MPPEDSPIDIHGIDDAEARATLWETLNSQSISGVQARLTPECDPVWEDETDLPDFDRELKRGGVQMVWAQVCMKPITFLRLQAAASSARRRDRSVDAETFLREPLMGDATRLREMVRILEAGDRELPHPFVELDEGGDIRGFQEGRTRAMAAYYADLDAMPALVFLNTRKDDGVETVKPPSEFDLSAHLDREAPEFDNPDGPAGVEKHVAALEEAGFQNVSTKELGAHTAIDFEMPTEVPAETQRRIRASSFILDAEGHPRTFILRFPAIDVSSKGPDARDSIPRSDVGNALDDAVEATDLPVLPYIEGSVESLNPHIQSKEDASLPGGLELVEAFAEMRDVYRAGLVELDVEDFRERIEQAMSRKVFREGREAADAAVEELGLGEGAFPDERE